MTIRKFGFTYKINTLLGKRNQATGERRIFGIVVEHFDVAQAWTVALDRILAMHGKEFLFTHTGPIEYVEHKEIQ